ncbi:hypothetical protein ANO11243_031870 [Dothideomycetidae sp. 11243]|nr:hypothetical protein ANO11243_031870 [fungal sp. No.11243]
MSVARSISRLIAAAARTASPQHTRTLISRHTASSPRRRAFTSTPPATYSSPPKTRDRGPPSKEDTQTDFAKMDILAATPPPSTAVDACSTSGFLLNSGLQVEGCGVLLIGGEALRWKPWTLTKGSSLFNGRGQLDVPDEAWGALRLVWPKPDLLVIGTGKRIAPIAPATRAALTELGVRVEVQDTRNAAAQFNLLATERGVQQVAAALVPVGMDG